MTDKIFIFGKDLFEYINGESIAYSCPWDNIQLQISDWETLTLTQKTTITTKALAYGFVET